MRESKKLSRNPPQVMLLWVVSWKFYLHITTVKMIKHYLFTSNVKYFFILSRTSFNSYLCNTPTHSPVVIVRGGECEDRYKVIALFTGIIFIKPVWLVVCFCFWSDVDVTMLSSLNISRVESVCCEINPEFGMYDGDLSSSSGSDSTGEDDTSRWAEEC